MSVDEMRAYTILLEGLPADGLRLLRYAFMLDLRDADGLETRIFADGRLRAIEGELRRRGEPLETPDPARVSGDSP